MRTSRAAGSLGHDTDRFKLLAFVLSAALAGLAGGTKAIIFQVTSPSDIHWLVSGFVILMVLMGGLGTVLGPTIGAILTSMDYYLAEFGSWVLIIKGVAFIVFVLVFRRGVVGEVAFAERRCAALARAAASSDSKREGVHCMTMPEILKDKTIVLTGAGQGLGEATAFVLAEAGAKLVSST